jgi:hypothetical protein
VCDEDIPLGLLFDFACYLKTFIAGKIQEHQATEQAQQAAAAPAAPAAEPVTEKAPQEE